MGDNRIVKKISAGRGHNCVIVKNNDVFCWGYNEDYELGTGSVSTNIGDGANEMGNNLSATHLVTQDAVYLEVGAYSTCVIRKNGILYCWGFNGDGDLGVGLDDDEIGDSSTMPDDVDVDLGTDRRAKVMARGYQHGCALLENNDIKCWGRSNQGQLGQGDTSYRGDTASDMGDNLPAVDLVPDILGVVWEGYSLDNVDFNDSPPSLKMPTGEPSGTTFAYTTTTSDVCTVDSAGALTITNNGTCTVELTASLADHRDEVRTFDVTVNAIDTNGFDWRGYSSGTATFPNAPTLVIPTHSGGIGYGEAYSSQTPTVCTVTPVGTLTLLRNGLCTIRVTISARGYNDVTIDRSIIISKGTMSITWSGYSSNSVAVSGTAPTPSSPTGAPTGATFAYSSGTTAVCTVDSATGALTLKTAGTCTITLTVSATGYNGQAISQSITVTSG